jgi:hypothetical protein
VQFLQELDAATGWEARKALLRVARPTPSIPPGTNVAAVVPHANGRTDGHPAPAAAPAVKITVAGSSRR